MYRYHRKELVTEMRMYEIKTIKPLTPDQARVKSMQDQVKRTHPIPFRDYFSIMMVRLSL